MRGRKTLAHTRITYRPKPMEHVYERQPRNNLQRARSVRRSAIRLRRKHDCERPKVSVHHGLKEFYPLSCGCSCGIHPDVSANTSSIVTMKQWMKLRACRDVSTKFPSMTHQGRCFVLSIARRKQVSAVRHHRGLLSLATMITQNDVDPRPDFQPNGYPRTAKGS